MRTAFTFLSLVCFYWVEGQLTITSSAEFSMTGNAQLTLQNINLTNNGNFFAGNGTVTISGNSSSVIAGTQPLQFYNLQINKSSGTLAILLKHVGVSGQLNFSDGFLNLNGFEVDLGTTGTLQGEQEMSRVIGSNGGVVRLITNLNAPSFANPGNLGALITSGQNLGDVEIRRGHQSQINSFSGGSSILRYFDITPANNNSLNATLRFQYFDGELNGLDENGLILWKSITNVNWLSQGFDSKNAASNYVEKNSINDFSRWTLSTANNPLPVQFILLNLTCGGNQIQLKWKTANEQNNKQFVIERSINGIQWQAAGVVTASVNNTAGSNYSFIDNSPVTNGFYRIAQYDVNGAVRYSGIIRSACQEKETVGARPNPVKDRLYITIVSENEGPVIICLYDSKGAMTIKQSSMIMKGSNQVELDTYSLAAGVYYLKVITGTNSKNITIFKD